MINFKGRFGATVMHWAAYRGDVDMMRSLVSEYGGDVVSSKDNNGRTPLDWAVERRQTTMVHELLSVYNCNPADTDSDGFSVLHVAAAKGKLDIIKLLAAAGADPRVQSTGGSTLLHEAVREIRYIR